MWTFIMIAAFFVSLFCKLNARRFHFHNVLLLISTTFTAGKLIGVIAPTVIFNLHNLTGARYLQHLGYALLIFWFVLRLQRYALRRWRRRYRVIVATAAAGLAMILAELWLDGRFGDRDRMTSLGVPFSVALGLKQGTDDLLFDIGRAITAIDKERIRTLEAIEADRDGN
jgi:hypothetical protein